MADLKQTGAEVQALLDKAETLNASFVDTTGTADEPETPEWKLYVDEQIGDINTILDNINGESA